MNMSHNHVVDIYTISYQPDEYLDRCITSILRHTSEPYNLIVVVGKRPISSNRNEGLRVSSSTWVASIDSDCTVQQDNWLELLLETANRDPKVALVGCKVVMHDGTIFSCGTNPNSIPRGSGEVDTGQYESVEEIHAVTENLMLVRRDILYFDELFNRSKGYEGQDFAMRLRAKGYKVMYDGRVKVTHHKYPVPRSAFNWDHIYFHLKHPMMLRHHLRRDSTFGTVLRWLRRFLPGSSVKS